MESSTQIKSYSPTPSSISSSSCMADAQQLNNFATLYIESGHYENAIVVLQEALRLWEEHRVRQVLSKAQEFWCSCSSCTLDGCIAFSEKQQQNLLNRNCHLDCNSCCYSTRDHTVSENGSKRRRISAEKAVKLNKHDDREDTTNTSLKRKTRSFSKSSSETDGLNCGYTYQNPIRIPKRHNMGSACFFVILFNLTLANHLKVLNEKEVRKDKLKDVLNLYELTFEYWSRLHADRRVDRENDTTNNSLRFLMILFNNMSQMYRMVDNATKQRQCLESLLSIVMIAVECNARLASIRRRDNVEESVQYHENFQQSIEGFLTNVMPPQQCAEAA